MTIIEKEIAKRETLINERCEKEQEAKALRERAELLEQEVSEIDVDTLQAEVEELKSYLTPVVNEEPVIVEPEVVAAEVVEEIKEEIKE